MTTKFKVHINCGNDAFATAPEEEVARILRKLADQIEQGFTGCYLTDYNGNTVGFAEFKEEE